MLTPIRNKMRSLGSRLTSFGRCTVGATALEFAFAAPILFLAAGGIMEITMIQVKKVLVEGGLREASRYGITGSEPSAGAREARIIEIVNQHANGMVTVTM